VLVDKKIRFIKFMISKASDYPDWR